MLNMPNKALVLTKEFALIRKRNEEPSTEDELGTTTCWWPSVATGFCYHKPYWTQAALQPFLPASLMSQAYIQGKPLEEPGFASLSSAAWAGNRKKSTADSAVAARTQTAEGQQPR